MRSKNILMHNAICVKCKKIYKEKYIVLDRQETLLCPHCIKYLIKQHLKFHSIQINDNLYIAKRYTQNHKHYYKPDMAKLIKVEIINTWLPLNLKPLKNILNENNELIKLDFNQEALSRYCNFKIEYLNYFFKYTLKDINGTNEYIRNYNEVFKTELEAQTYCTKLNNQLEFRRNQRMFKNYLYVDDIRQIPRELYDSYKCFQASCYKETITKLKRTKYSVIDLDHDLGEEKTGYDICKYIIQNNLQFDKIRIHTSNPVGRDNMIQLLERYTDIPIEIY